jgi:prepilin-type N-terminal cleavage/methylation domain-containing protein/prepilin-type processing-associated H-X9-DG protein
MRMALRTTGRLRAFTLIELLVVVSIIGLLLAMLLPSLSHARRAAKSVACTANLRSLSLAQLTYANTHDDALVVAGDGSYDTQGSWIGLLEGQGAQKLVRRCPMDESIYFDTPFTDYAVPVLRETSYGINNYVSPTHAPLGVHPVRQLSQVPNPAGLVQFVELAESGDYAVADHIHVQEFYNPLTPKATPTRASIQMAIGRHGGRAKDWSGAANYGFMDGHAETLSLKSVYADPTRNRFIPDVDH